MIHTLTKLGFDPKLSNGVIAVTVPSWRATKDISLNEDIVEEIGRIHGYDEIDERPIPGLFDISKRNYWTEFRAITQDYFAGKALYEAFNYSFSNEAKDRGILIENFDDAVRIKNAVSEEFTLMRRFMAPLLLINARENRKQSQKFGFFEIAKIHTKHAENDFSESKRVAGILIGSDIQDLRNLIDGYFAQTTSADLAWKIEQGVTDTTPYFHPNKSGRYMLGDDCIATFGYIHPRVLTNFDLTGEEVVFFDIDAEKLAALARKKSVAYREPSKFPSISRELNFVLPDRENTGNIARAIAAVDPRISSPKVVDTYIDETKVGVGKKSVTFSFMIEDRTKTITDEEAGEIQSRVISGLAEKGYMLRS